MAKRVRGNRSNYRPGGQGPSRNTKTDDASGSTPEGASDAPVGADIDGAVETVETAYTEIAIDEGTPAATKPRRTRRSAKARSDSLSVRAGAEDAFVREDLRRIGLVTIFLVFGLAVAWVLFYAMDLLGLY